VRAKQELETISRLVEKGRLTSGSVGNRVKKALRREHLSSFVVTEIGGTSEEPTFSWRVDAERRRVLETTRLGRRVLCTDRHTWTNERIVTAFRGQWNVEEMFRRSKKGGVVPWGPSFQWADASLRLHTFAAVIGLLLVSLARQVMKSDLSARRLMESLAEIEATQVRTAAAGIGRRPTVLLAPQLDEIQRRAVKVFELDRWLPALASARRIRSKRSTKSGV
jgi:transposase